MSQKKAVDTLPLDWDGLLHRLDPRLSIERSYLDLHTGQFLDVVAPEATDLIEDETDFDENEQLLKRIQSAPERYLHVKDSLGFAQHIRQRLLRFAGTVPDTESRDDLLAAARSPLDAEQLRQALHKPGRKSLRDAWNAFALAENRARTKAWVARKKLRPATPAPW